MSQEHRFRTLISGLSLTGKPSELYEQMRRLANGLDESFIRSLWIDRLPEDLQIVLTVAETRDSRNLTQLADKVMEVLERRRQSQQQYLATISKTGSHQNCDKQFQNLTNQILDLSSKLDSIINNLKSHQSRGRSRSKESRSHSSAQNARNNQKTCFYHQKFGPKASKCNPPCLWSNITVEQQGNESSHR